MASRGDGATNRSRLTPNRAHCLLGGLSRAAASKGASGGANVSLGWDAGIPSTTPDKRLLLASESGVGLGGETQPIGRLRDQTAVLWPQLTYAGIAADGDGRLEAVFRTQFGRKQIRISTPVRNEAFIMVYSRGAYIILK